MEISGDVSVAFLIVTADQIHILDDAHQRTAKLLGDMKRDLEDLEMRSGAEYEEVRSRLTAAIDAAGRLLQAIDQEITKAGRS